MSVGSGIEKARTKLAAKASKFMTRTCSLIPQIKADDGFHGHKMIDGTAVTGVPVTVEFVSGGFSVNDGGTVVVKSHRLEFPVTAQTMAITKSYKIDVQAEGLTPRMIFEHPVTQLGDTDVFLTVGASFAEGYGQPATA